MQTRCIAHAPSTRTSISPAARNTEHDSHLNEEESVDREAEGNLIDPVQPDSSSDTPRMRAPGTEIDYANRVGHLYRASIQARTQDPTLPANVSPETVVADLIKSTFGPQPTRSHASWNLYRAALLWHLSTKRADGEAYQRAYAMLAATKRPPGKRAGAAADDSTRARQQKPRRSIPEQDLSLLLDTLVTMNRSACWGARTQYWLRAGLATGVRINEWAGTSWADTHRQALLVPNSKRKLAAPAFHQPLADGQTVHDLALEGRAKDADPTRPSMRVVPVDVHDRMFVDLHIQSLHAFIVKQGAASSVDAASAFRKYYDNCRKTLHAACQRAFRGRRSYSLRVMRGQFAANAKSENPLSAVSELMGHESSGRTTMGNYGHRSKAHKGRAHTMALRDAPPGQAQAPAVSQPREEAQDALEGVISHADANQGSET